MRILSFMLTLHLDESMIEIQDWVLALVFLSVKDSPLPGIKELKLKAEKFKQSKTKITTDISMFFDCVRF